jgi:hypothetical protein
MIDDINHQGDRGRPFLTETGADDWLLNWLLKALPTQPN